MAGAALPQLPVACRLEPFTPPTRTGQQGLISLGRRPMIGARSTKEPPMRAVFVDCPPFLHELYRGALAEIVPELEINLGSPSPEEVKALLAGAPLAMNDHTQLDAALLEACPSLKAIVFLGTSLTAGLGLDPEQAYPALIQRKIDSAGLPFEAVNAGVSGETSAGARRRIDWLLRQPVSVLVVETGANDGLRGLEVDSLRANIQAIVDEAKQLSPPPAIVLVGMRAPPNLGLGYARRFPRVYSELADDNDLPLVPFLLEGVAGQASLNQADMIHPTAQGQRLMAERVWEVLEPVLKQAV